MPKATYTQQEVAELFDVDVPSLYDMPRVLACRVETGSPRRVRYSKAKIDAMLACEAVA